MKKTCLLIYCCISLSTAASFAQTNLSWWNDVHNWDGTTHWTQYMTYSTSFMGPNSIPVPELKKGVINNSLRFENGVTGYWSKGDDTYNIFQKLNVPIANDRIAMQSWIVPIEYYKTDTATRDMRAARKKSGEGIEGGDFYFATLIQLIQDKEKLPDVLLSLNFKTSSGTGIKNARFTDASAYFFDISFHKEYTIGQKTNKKLHLYALTGVYIYQTHIPQYFQNDALMLGLGTDLEFENHIISNQIASYLGYLNIGDKPVVYRFELEKKNEKKLKWNLKFEHGIQDYPFTSASFGLLYDIPLQLFPN
ncbi:MAG: hypothetical protein HKO56_04540 [Bacteroidia bacterium]|nr:hypothetical protein [Bacteroidia bacterium]